MGWKKTLAAPARSPEADVVVGNGGRVTVSIDAVPGELTTEESIAGVEYLMERLGKPGDTWTVDQGCCRPGVAIVVSGLAPGTYRLRVRENGFSETTTGDLVVDDASDLRTELLITRGRTVSLKPRTADGSPPTSSWFCAFGTRGSTVNEVMVRYEAAGGILVLAHVPPGPLELLITSQTYETAHLSLRGDEISGPPLLLVPKRAR
jgi:hypothetical protein